MLLDLSSHSSSPQGNEASIQQSSPPERQLCMSRDPNLMLSVV